MKIPLSNRLLLCASMVEKNARVADVGTDHGYLPIYLLKQGICEQAIASDIREQPLNSARRNAVKYEVQTQLQLIVSDGVQNIEKDSFDTVICAGMGGDCMIEILQAAPWLKNEQYTLILQPQSSGNDLRRYLGENGFSIVEEHLAQDGRFLYTAMKVRYGGGKRLTPGQQYVSQALLAEAEEQLVPYLLRVEQSLKTAIAGILKAKPEKREKLEYYTAALQEIEAHLQTVKMKEGSTNADSQTAT